MRKAQSYTISMYPDTKEKLEEVAKLLGISQAEVIRNCVNQAHKQVIQKKENE
jgi:predicted DNA-binding protein